jgi:hypothetical protein
MRALLLLSVPVLIVSAACNAGTQSDFGGAGGVGNGAGSESGPGSGTFSSGTNGLSSTSTFGTGASAGAGGGNNGCSAAAQLVYVFSVDNKIYSFDPPSKQFKFIATPDCMATAQANSMAIDRNLVAWLNYIGSIYSFDLKTKTGCKLAMNLPSGFEQIGMGFSTDSVNGTAETLYVDGIGGGGLAKVDTNAKTLTQIGGFSNDNKLAGQSAELTGTGDARLFGYFTTSPNVRVAQIDKGNANITADNALNGVAPPSDWAFSFWGGDFYLYAAPGSNSSGNSSVIHYSAMTNQVDPTYVSDVGFQIIGAGVSTCAPIVPPS